MLYCRIVRHQIPAPVSRVTNWPRPAIPRASLYAAMVVRMDSAQIRISAFAMTVTRKEISRTMIQSASLFANVRTDTAMKRVRRVNHARYESLPI